MAKFTLIGTGPQAAEPAEATAQSAIEAETLWHSLRRSCGQFGTIVILIEGGKVITIARLASMAVAERAAPGC